MFGELLEDVLAMGDGFLDLPAFNEPLDLAIVNSKWNSSHKSVSLPAALPVGGN